MLTYLSLKSQHMQCIQHVQFNAHGLELVCWFFFCSVSFAFSFLSVCTIVGVGFVWWPTQQHTNWGGLETTNSNNEWYYMVFGRNIDELLFAAEKSSSYIHATWIYVSSARRLFNLNSGEFALIMEWQHSPWLSSTGSWTNHKHTNPRVVVCAWWAQTGITAHGGQTNDSQHTTNSIQHSALWYTTNLHLILLVLRFSDSEQFQPCTRIIVLTRNSSSSPTIQMSNLKFNMKFCCMQLIYRLENIALEDANLKPRNCYGSGKRHHAIGMHKYNHLRNTDFH